MHNWLNIMILDRVFFVRMGSRSVVGLAFGLLLGLQNLAGGATIVAKSTSFNDVSAAVAAASEGDTVSVPAGSSTWASTLTVTKSINLIGAGQSERGKTTIVQGVDTMLELQMTLHKDMRLSGITFKGTITADGSKPNWIKISGADTHLDPSHGLRIDHCSFEGGSPAVPVRGYTIYFTASTTGVIDHCFWGPGVDGETTRVGHDKWNDGIFGDKSFIDSPSYGTSMNQAVFFEDNIFECIDYANDASSGGRQVLRHNFYWGQRPGAHGIDSGGPGRGMYLTDVYNNIIRRNSVAGIQSAGPIPIQQRGGSMRAFNNYAIGTYNTFMNLYHYRMGRPVNNSTSPWFGANGRNPWDYNDRGNHTSNSNVTIDGSTFTVPGNGVDVSAICNGSRSDGSNSTNVPCKPADARYGYIYANGTYSGSTVTAPGNITLSLTSPNSNSWQFYTFINKSMNSNADTCDAINFAIIGSHGAGNGTTTLALSNVSDTKLPPFTISNGQQWEIRRVVRSIDQVGVGKTANTVGGTSGATSRFLSAVTDSSNGQVVSSPGYPSQELNGVYAWNNKMVTEAQDAANPSYRTAAGWSKAPDGVIDVSGGGYNPLVSSKSNPNAQIFLGREIFNRAPKTSDLNGDYSWNATTPAGSTYPETRVGPDDDAVQFAWGGQPPDGYIPSFYIDGSGGYAYPHPFVSGQEPPPPTPTPTPTPTATPEAPQNLQILPEG